MKEKSMVGRINDWLWQTTDRRAVTRDLADTRWDWLRRPRGLDAVIALSLLALYAGPVAVWFIDDGIGILVLVLVASIFGVWFLLRRAVRLVADAPDEALDERLIAIRDRIHLSAYRSLGSLMSVGLVAILAWSLWSGEEEGLSVAFSVTWPQTNAVVWFVLGQIIVSPSLALAIALRQGKVRL